MDTKDNPMTPDALDRRSRRLIQCQLKLKLRPAQERMLNRWLWHLTGVYNWAIKTIEREAALGFRLSKYDLTGRLVGHPEKLGIPEQALRGTVFTAHDAWQRRFQGLGRKPHLKGRRRPLNSIAFPSGRVTLYGDRLQIPGFGRVRFHAQEIPDGHVGTARLVKRASGWYLCLFVRAERAPIDRTAHGEVGIDPGFASLLTLSTGEKIDSASEFAATESRLAQAQRGHDRKLTARLHERIRNQRKNRNHHLSRRLIAENTLIGFSVDSIRGIARRFGKSVTAAAHSELRSQLRYKSLTGGTEFIEVPSRNSTRRCSSCGALTGPSGLHSLKVRHWECACGATHDRDVNAAVNTLVAARGLRVERAGDCPSGIST